MELSSKIKAMKFMKRKEDADERKKLETLQRELAQKGHWKLAVSGPTAVPRFQVEYDPTLSSASTLAGRHSYGKFNPETEKLNAEEKGKMAKSRAGDGKSISDQDMAASLPRRQSSVSKRPLE
jgi:hypothetical protein